MNKCQVEHIQILNKTHVPVTKSLEKLQVLKTLQPQRAYREKRQSPKMKPKYHEKKYKSIITPKIPKVVSIPTQPNSENTTSQK
jgi:hypothetical protein